MNHALARADADMRERESVSLTPALSRCLSVIATHLRHALSSPLPYGGGPDDDHAVPGMGGEVPGRRRGIELLPEPQGSDRPDVVLERDPDQVANFVVPVVRVERIPDCIRYVGLAGTAFLLEGTGGLAMTARHVADGLVLGESAVLFIGNDGRWQPVAIQEIEKHPTQDVAALRLEPDDYSSPFTLSRTEEHSSLHYTLWGYPDAVLHEIVDSGGMAEQRPDLVYSEGYIRRRITRALPVVRGSRFYELSTVSGAGCSGAPVISGRRQDYWKVIGVYVGQRRSEGGDLAVGYAVRISDLDIEAPSWSALFSANPEWPKF
ncbi:S1 family peptidase [Streptomyces lasiicapitis]|uniref:S1 family peptidase n=1 Tax=Streptomyces lasiicapitis TaxID=1923961 RepID=UPI0036A1CFF3